MLSIAFLVRSTIELFTQQFISFTEQLTTPDKGVIGLDGKSMRRTKGKNKHSAIHILNAYCVENQLCIGQMPMLEKSNEITAAPLLLDKLDIEDGIVTADALLCQKEIASKIIEKKADYLLALKENQGALLEDVRFYFDKEDEKPESWNELNYFETVEKGHGRVETRYYISSIPMKYFKKMARASRAHWAIENNLHWQLDVSFNEDGWASKAGNVAENIALINKLAINMVKKETSRKVSMRAKRASTALSDDYMEKVIFNYANCVR
jgi:predicted transposase YbfD/YdcC